MIKPLTSLRFFFALMFFLSHLGFLYGINAQTDVGLDSFVKEYILFKEGYLGVSFFFILSGFILSYNYSDKFKNKSISFKTYMRARFFRIVPLHWLTLLFSIFLSIAYINNITGFLLKLAANTFLLQSFVPVKDFYFGFNGVSWSISDEMFFYTLFPLLVLWIYKKKQNYFLAVLSLCIPILALSFFYNYSNSYWLFYVNPFFRIFDFIIGILLFKVYLKLKEFNFKINFTFVEITAILLLVCFVSFKDQVHQSFRWSIYYWIPMTWIILVFSLAKGLISKILSHKSLLLLGEISFSFYMIHQLVIKVLWALNFKLHFTKSSILITLLSFLISVVLSYIAYNFFEKPINKRFKKPSL